MDAGFPPGREGMSDATGLGITESTNWVREILANPEGPPGQGFEYSNRTSHLLAAIVGQAAGISPLDYARKRLFGPLGIDSTPAWTEVVGRGGIEAYESSGFAWPKDPQGINTGWALLKTAVAGHGEAGAALPRRGPVGGPADRSRRSGSRRQPRSRSTPATRRLRLPVVDRGRGRRHVVPGDGGPAAR